MAEAVSQLPNFSHLFQDSSYIAGYRDWRRGQPKGCKGEIGQKSARPPPVTSSFRQQYNAWRRSHAIARKGGAAQLLRPCDALLFQPAPLLPALQETPVRSPLAPSGPPKPVVASGQKMLRCENHPYLDADSWVSVLRHVPAADLNKCMSVCWSFHSVASSPVLWCSQAVCLDVRCCGSADAFSRTLLMLLQQRRVRQLKLLHLDEESLCKAACVLQSSTVCTSLETLDLSSSAQMPIERLCDVLRRVPALQALDLGSCWWLQDGQLQQLLLAAPNLTLLNLSSCTKLTDAAASSICTLRRLRRLNLRCCKQMGPAVVAAIATANCSLTALDLSFCPRMNDDAVAALAELASLEELKLNMCRKVSDGGVVVLARKCTMLRHLELSWCAIGDAGVHNLSKMPRLQYVNLLRCGKVQKDAHQVLCKLAGLEVGPASWNQGMFAAL